MKVLLRLARIDQFFLVLPKNFDLADCKIAENLTTENLLFTLNICLETDD
ncbi:hypothetical protein [Fischerella thermalis]|nr:hypothetical protein [Fischerella thermalis]MBF1990657.1 hypothetical protein [Fischerella thermalis M58_A2018_009]MBF2061326.1 hypothetical protein [Fischerella thermalis M66_A2018_004]